MGSDAARWQGETAKWALAHEEEQRRQRAVALPIRVCSDHTQRVKVLVEGKLNVHAVLQAVSSGQLPDLGSVQPLIRDHRATLGESCLP